MFTLFFLKWHDVILKKNIYIYIVITITIRVPEASFVALVSGEPWFGALIGSLSVS